MKYLTFIVLLVSFISISYSEELPKELYMPNDAGGFIVVTVEDCPIKHVSKKFPNRAYATEIVDGKEITHEGCWMSGEAPNDPRFFSIFNIFFEPDIIATYPQRDFGPNKKRLEEQPQHFNPEDLI